MEYEDIMGNRSSIIDELCKYVKNNDIESIKRLVKLGININSLNSEGYTPLVYAIQQYWNGNDRVLETIQILIDSGADVNQCIHNCGPNSFCVQIPLFFAIHQYNDSPNIEIAKLLIDKGTCLEGSIGSYLLYKAAGNYRNHEIIQLLLDAGADPNGYHDERTSLDRAAENKCIQNTHILLNYGARCGRRGNKEFIDEVKKIFDIKEKK